jgi:competence protein ComEC
MTRILWSLVALCALVLPALAGEKRGLEIWFVDTEGGAATLIVTPAGESILIDSGNPGKRDAERIHRVATERAKLTAIDHHIVTHWHTDHFGGVERLSQLMPIKHYYHHGIPESLVEDKKDFPTLIKAFRAAADGKDTVLKPGDVLPLKQAEGSPTVELVCLCANGETIADKPGATVNAVAKEHRPKEIPPTDNDNSLGFLLKFGGFRFLDLGDLTWNYEYKLVHPTDKIGQIDIFQSTHHGLEISNNPVLIKTVQPRVAIFNNGPKKGGHPMVVGTLRRLPEPPTIYQMHRNVLSSAAENTDPEFIANQDEDCKAEPIGVAIAADAKSYTVSVPSTKHSRTYKTRE